MPFKLGPLELVLILVIIFIIFGPGKLPQIVGSVGKSIRSFRESRAGELDEEEGVTAKKPRRVRKATA
jgi:sec-independent protein translocase protein TatA